MLNQNRILISVSDSACGDLCEVWVRVSPAAPLLLRLLCPGAHLPPAAGLQPLQTPGRAPHRHLQTTLLLLLRHRTLTSLAQPSLKSPNCP